MAQLLLLLLFCVGSLSDARSSEAVSPEKSLVWMPGPVGCHYPTCPVHPHPVSKRRTMGIKLQENSRRQEGTELVRGTARRGEKVGGREKHTLTV